MSGLREPDWPEGWHWSSDDRSLAVGPGGRAAQSVWINTKAPHSPTVEFSFGMDSAPLVVVASVMDAWIERGPE